MYFISGETLYFTYPNAKYVWWFEDGCIHYNSPELEEGETGIEIVDMDFIQREDWEIIIIPKGNKNV